MINWTEIRERYAQGGVTHEQLSKEFDVSIGALRRRSAAEGWCKLRTARSAQSGDPAEALRREKQIRLADSILDAFIGGLDLSEELHTFTETQKNGSSTVTVTEKREALNLDRIAKLIKTTADIFELIHIASGQPDYKDAISERKLERDCELAIRKLEQDGSIATRKLDLEKLKIEGVKDDDCASDGFLAALGIGMTGGAADAIEV